MIPGINAFYLSSPSLAKNVPILTAYNTFLAVLTDISLTFLPMMPTFTETNLILQYNRITSIQYSSQLHGTCMFGNAYNSFCIFNFGWC